MKTPKHPIVIATAAVTVAVGGYLGEMIRPLSELETCSDVSRNDCAPESTPQHHALHLEYEDPAVERNRVQVGPPGATGQANIREGHDVVAGTGFVSPGSASV